MLRTIAMLTAFAVLPQELGAAKDLGVTGLALFLAIVLANVVTKLVDRRSESPEAVVLRKIERGLSADTAAIAALVAQMRTAEGVATERHAALIDAIKARAA